MAYESATHDGITIETNTGNADVIRAALTDSPVPEKSEPVEVEEAAAEGEPVKAEPAAEPAKAPKKGKPREDPRARIDQLTAQKHDAERRAEAAEQRARELEERATRAPEKPAEKTAPAPEPKRERFPKLAEWAALPENVGKDWDDYADARDEFNEAQREAKWRDQEAARERDRELQTQAERYGSRLKAARQADPDLKIKIAPDILNAKPISGLAKNEKPTFSNLVAEVGLHSEYPAVLYVALSENDNAEATRIANLPPSRWESALWQLEGRLSSSQRESALPLTHRDSAAASGSVEKPTTSQAAPPIKPVGSTPQLTDPDADSDGDSVEEFFRKGNTRDRQRGRR